MIATQSHATPLTYRLQIGTGEDKQDLLLQPGNYSLGRCTSNDIILPVADISRKHARLTVCAEEGIFLEDLGSCNGTKVEGWFFTKGAVKVGAEIHLGNTPLRLEETDIGDTELALSLCALTPSIPPPAHSDPPGMPMFEALQESSTTAVNRRSLKRGSRTLQTLEDVVDLMLEEGIQWTELPEALRLLAPQFGVNVVALLEWTEDSGWVALAAEGDLRPYLEDPAYRHLLQSVEGRKSSRCEQALSQSGNWVGAALSRRDASPLGLVIADSKHQHLPTPSTLCLLLRLFDMARPGITPPARPQPQTALVFPKGWVLGTSTAAGRLYDELSPLIRSSLPVLLTGETGVGKEQLARVLHTSSPRSDGPLVALNCAAIPAELLEAEMFGIGRGVATAVRARPGRLQEASGGTLFLDEIGEMAPSLQAKLLRALQEKEVQPLGEAPVEIDVRIVAATNLDLQKRVEEGTFRRDLYYRVAGAVVHVPPLRERRDDIPALVEHFLRRYAAEQSGGEQSNSELGAASGKTIRGVTIKALELLLEYSWPGNVRELQHEMERLVAVCPTGQAIDSNMLADSIRQPHLSPPIPTGDDSSLRLAAHLQRVERKLITAALKRCQGSQRQAAPLLGVSRNALARKIKSLSITV